MGTPSASTRSTRNRPNVGDITPSSGKTKRPTEIVKEETKEKIAKPEDSEATEAEDASPSKKLKTPTSRKSKRKTPASKGKQERKIDVTKQSPALGAVLGEGSLRLEVGAAAPRSVKTSAGGIVKKPNRGRVKKANSKASELLELGRCLCAVHHVRSY